MMKVKSSTLPFYKKEPKKNFEHAPNALGKQLSELQQHHPDIALKLKTIGIEPPKNSAFSIEKLNKIDNALGCSKQKMDVVGKYINKETDEFFYIKCPPDWRMAKNEVLMAQLARAMGMQAPNLKLHEENNKTYVVSPWVNDLKYNKSALQNASAEERAKTYLISSLLDNADCIGRWNNTGINEEGQLVSIDWGEAGLYGSPNGTRRKSEFSSIPVALNAFKKPDETIARSYFPSTVSTQVRNASTLFKNLSEEALTKAARPLLNLPSKTIDSLIEVYGPDKPGERQWLRQTIHERIAFLARIFPDAVESGQVSMAEKNAINAAGIRGYALSVEPKYIEDGKVHIRQLLDKGGRILQTAHFKLTDAGVQIMADRASVGSPHHDLARLIRFYKDKVNDTEKTKSLAFDLKILAKQCDFLAESIFKERARYIQTKKEPSEISNKSTLNSDTDNLELNDTIDKLNKISALCQEQAKPPYQGKVNLSELPTLQKNCFLDRLIRLPDNVGLIEVDASGSYPLNESHRMHACRTGKTQNIITNTSKVQPHSYRWYCGEKVITAHNSLTASEQPLMQSSKVVTKASENEDLKKEPELSPEERLQRKVTIKYHGNDLEMAKAFERTVEITTQCDADEKADSNQIIATLKHLKLVTGRPSYNTLQEQYLDKLIEFYNLEYRLPDSPLMIEKEKVIREHVDTEHNLLKNHKTQYSLKWEDNCDMMDGSLVFYVIA